MGKNKILLSKKDFKALRTTRGKQITGWAMALTALVIIIAVIANPKPGVDYSTLLFISYIFGIVGLLLVLRTSKDGNQFYGCSNFPTCRFTKKVDNK